MSLGLFEWGVQNIQTMCYSIPSMFEQGTKYEHREECITEITSIRIKNLRIQNLRILGSMVVLPM